VSQVRGPSFRHGAFGIEGALAIGSRR
jgi:hypothetical protein